MALSQLPDDVIAPILRYLNGPDTVSLSRIGDMGFHAKVKRNDRYWRIQCRPFTLFPFSVYDVLGLASLEVFLGPDDGDYALDLGNRSLAPLVTQNQLVTLKFSFPNCMRVLEDSKLMEFAPNLQNLSCQDSYRAFAEVHLSKLPMGLKTLHLETPERHRTVLLSMDLFAHILPRPLESVHISRISLKIPPSTDHLPQLSWPKNLKSISTAHMPIPLMFDYGPPLIESLKGIPTWSLSEANISMARIPKTMKEVDMLSYMIKDTRLQVVLDSAMPPLMHTFMLSIVAPPSNVLTETFFTPTLTSLDSFLQLQATFPNVAFHTLLPNISDVPLDFVEEVKLEMLPLNCKNLKTQCNLPNTLLSQLPQTLTSLICGISPGWSLEHLPRTLTELLIMPLRREIISPIPASQWRLLPPNLKFICIDLIMLESAACLAEIPSQKLKELSFSATSLSEFDGLEKDAGAEDILKNYNEKVLRDKRLIQYLPTELELLEMKLNSTDCEWAAWMQDLAKYLPKLTTLAVGRKGVPENPQCYTAEECFGNLPPLLKSLDVQIDPSLPLPTDIFSKFPRQLRKLLLVFRKTVGDGAESLLRDEHFTYLPTTLISLSFQLMRHLPAQSKLAIALEPLLTSEAISKLPPFLTSFPFDPDTLQARDWKEAWKHYCRSEKWLGCPPAEPR